MTIRFKHLAFLCTTILAMPLLSGCGGNDDDEPTPEHPANNENGGENSGNNGSDNNESNISFTAKNYFTANGRLSSKESNYFDTEYYTYDEDNRVTECYYYSPYDHSKYGYFYKYYDNVILRGNINSGETYREYNLENGRITSVPAFGATYTYDKNNRLTQIDCDIEWAGKFSVKINWTKNNDKWVVDKVVHGDGTITTIDYHSYPCTNPCILENFHYCSFFINVELADFTLIDVNLLAAGYYGNSSVELLPKNIIFNGETDGWLNPSYDYEFLNGKVATILYSGYPGVTYIWE